MPVLLLLPLLPSGQGRNIYLGAVFNSAHFFLAGAVTLLIAGGNSGSRKTVISVAIPVLAAILVELIQLAYPDRNSGIDDVVRSFLGSVCAVILLKGRKSFVLGSVFSVLFVYAVSYDVTTLIIRQGVMEARFPVLDDVGAPFYTKAWKPRINAALQRAEDEIVFTSFPNQKWSNIESNILPQDWRGYGVFSIETRSSRQVKCGIQVRTEKGNYYGEFRTDTFYEDHEIKFSEFKNGETVFESSFKVEGVSIFLSKPDSLTMVHIRRIRLQ